MVEFIHRENTKKMVKKTLGNKLFSSNIYNKGVQ